LRPSSLTHNAAVYESPWSRRLLLAPLSPFHFLCVLLLAAGLNPMPGVAQKNCHTASAAAKAPAAFALNVPRLAAVADSLARVQLAAGTLPGLSVAIAQNGRVVFARGYGQANVETGTPATPETEYKIRSLTKQFTAALVLRLVEAGKLSLDAPLTNYLPSYPTQGNTVTVRQLLNHTSGLTGLSSRLDMQTALNGGTRQWF
jgi:D-alanyl-D-alanine carboxypeptidase